MEDINNQTFESEKLIFIHIPKNYGTITMKYLFNLDKANSHITANQLYSIDKFKNYKTFCFVRNPFERFIIAYCWLTRPNKFPKNIIHHISLIETIEMLTNNNVTYPENMEWKYSDNKLWRHILPQSTWINKNTKIYYCENYENEINKLISDYNINLPKLKLIEKIDNKKKKNQIKTNFINILNTRQDLKDRFINFYKDDFINFDYSTDINKTNFSF